MQSNPLVTGRKTRKFNRLQILPSQLLPQLLTAGKVTLLPPPQVPDPLPKGYDPNARCEFHSGGAGHTTDKCYNLRNTIQDLIDQNLWNFQEEERSLVKPED